MNSVQKCEDLFNSLVSVIDAVYGSSMKTNIELIDIGAQIFPQLGHNVTRNADYDFEKMKGRYSIVNTDNGVGVHWFAVYQKESAAYIRHVRAVIHVVGSTVRQTRNSRRL